MRLLRRAPVPAIMQQNNAGINMSAQSPAVHLILGPDFGRREDAIKRIRRALEKEGAIERFSYYAEDVSPAELITQLYNGTLFHEHLLIVYRSVDMIRGKDAHARLRKYIQNPSRAATLILTSEKTSLSPAWAKEIPKRNVVTCWQPFESEINNEISKVFAARKMKVSAEIIAQIGSLSEQDSNFARQLAQQLVYFFRNQTEITAELLLEFIGNRHAISIFQLIDCLFARTTKEAVVMLHRLYAEQFNATQIASVVNSHIQKLWRALYDRANGVAFTDALRKQGIVWKAQTRTFQTGMQHFSLPELSRILVHNRDLEVRIRQMSDAYAQLLLTRLVIQVCEGPIVLPVRVRRPVLAY